MLTLIEQAEQNWDKDEAARMAKKFADQEDFTLDDFLSQMQQIRNMGSMLVKGATPLEAARTAKAFVTAGIRNRVASGAPFDALWQGGPR